MLLNERAMLHRIMVIWIGVTDFEGKHMPGFYEAHCMQRPPNGEAK
jgi:hypothetical protein